MFDMRQLVGEHAFELLVVENLEDPFRRRHGRVLRVAAGRESIRRRVGNHVDARLGQAGAHGQPGHGVVKAVAGTDLLRPIHP